MEKRLWIYGFLFFMMVFANSCKKDAEVNKDTFKIENEKVEAATQAVKISGSYSYAGVIDAITLEMGRQSDLMDGDAYRTLMDGTDFSVEVKNLRTNTAYYYRYAVDYGGKEPYRTEIKTFSTLEYNLPEVKSKDVVSVGVNRAEVSGEVISDGGGDAVTLRGICWSTSHNPSVGDEYANAGEGIGSFTCELTNLQPEKTYYARAFAGNSKGVAYGEELMFLTMATGSLAEVHTVGITGNAMLQATIQGNVTSEGTSAVLERGVCYSKEHYPTTSGLHVSSGSGAGEYTCQLINLEASSTYYVRAYAINSLGIAYGEEMSFVAQTETTTPVVTTQMVNGITQTSATGHGTVVSDGGAAVTRRGLCWSMEHDPTVDGTHADCGSGTGEFSGLLPHLTDMTTYYVRAYAENSVGLAYGEEVSFTVGQHGDAVPPTVITLIENEMVGGDVTNDGGAEVTERGVCWSTRPGPTIADDHISNGSGIGNYWIELPDLLPNTMYYVRAYAINRVGVGYGDEITFTTPSTVSPPTLSDVVVIDITATTAVAIAEVIDDGGTEVIERGVCWSTSHYPTLNDDHASSGMGTGRFTVEMTDLTPSTTYYVRAYAQNSAGTAYSYEMSFTTAPEVPGDEFSVDFDAGIPYGWTIIDNGIPTGYGWQLGSVKLGTGNGHNGSANLILSQSFDNNYGVVYPDNWFISPAVSIGNGSMFNFWACGQDASYAAEHFGVFVSTNGTNPSDFTMVNEWTLHAKSNGEKPAFRGNRQGDWYQYSVDLSAYAGQQVYIAIRHFNCTDQFYLDVDDIELTNNGKNHE